MQRDRRQLAGGDRRPLSAALGRAPAPRRRFSLIPLADAMFQLLTFFMLATSFQAFSSLGIKSEDAPEETAPEPIPAGTEEGEGGEGGNGAAGRLHSGVAVFWTIGAGTISVGGEDYGMEDRQALVERQAAAGEEVRVYLIVRRSARVEDFVWALEAWGAAENAVVRISREGT